MELAGAGAGRSPAAGERAGARLSGSGTGLVREFNPASDLILQCGHCHFVWWEAVTLPLGVAAYAKRLRSMECPKCELPRRKKDTYILIDDKYQEALALLASGLPGDQVGVILGSNGANPSTTTSENSPSDRVE